MSSWAADSEVQGGGPHAAHGGICQAHKETKNSFRHELQLQSPRDQCSALRVPD